MRTGSNAGDRLGRMLASLSPETLDRFADLLIQKVTAKSCAGL